MMTDHLNRIPNQSVSRSPSIIMSHRLTLFAILLSMSWLVFPGEFITGRPCSAQADEPVSGERQTLKVLFIGNSYTARHNLAEVVKAMAEERNPKMTMNVETVIYGGRTLRDHWRLGTQNIVRLNTLTHEEQKATVDSLVELSKDPKDRYAGAALKRHRQLLSEMESRRTKWDVIVLQSYRDDLSEERWPYAEYAEKFARLAKQLGARVVLYETTPTTQNAKPLTSPPSPDAVLAKATRMARLSNQINANAAPMSLIAHRCQEQRPDLTLRFENDAHLNQTMAYLTACTLFAAMFEQTPQGLSIDSITDIRFWQNKDRTKDRDEKPITRVFPDSDRADLQRIAWEGYQEFEKLRRENGNRRKKTNH